MLAAACAPSPILPTPTVIPARRLTIIGEPSLLPLVQQLNELYHRQRPYVTLDMQEGNSTLALQEFVASRADFALLVREPQPDELTRANAQMLELGRDGIAIIVNPENSLQGLTRAQVTQVFSGEISEWPALNARLPQGASPIIAVVSRESGSGTRQVFETLAIGTRRVTLTALMQPSERHVLEYVAAQPDAIGYISIHSLGSRVRALAIDGVAPSLASLASGKYPYPRKNYLVAAAHPQAEVAALLQFLETEPAQQVIAKYLVKDAP